MHRLVDRSQDISKLWSAMVCITGKSAWEYSNSILEHHDRRRAVAAPGATYPRLYTPEDHIARGTRQPAIAQLCEDLWVQGAEDIIESGELSRCVSRI